VCERERDRRQRETEREREREIVIERSINKLRASHFKLGLFMLSSVGQGVESDQVKAYQWYRYAAEQVFIISHIHM
jgi:hypothetical protein